MMRRKPSAKVASVGVAHAKLAIEEKLGWLLREQPTEDYDIDAHVEVVDEDMVRGRLLALQIKSGTSWFKEPGPEGWWFRPDEDHVQYWTNHSLPVVVVLYRPETKRCHWQLVNRETLVEPSTGGWKLLVPEAQVLDGSARTPLREAVDGDPYVLRIRELQLARPWMELLADGKRLVMDMEEWINKTSGHGSILLGVDNDDGEDPAPLASWGVFLGFASYAEVVPQLFAWADVSVHEETYDEAEHDPTIGVMATLTGYQSGAQTVADTYGVVILQLREPTEADLRGRLTKIRLVVTARLPIILPNVHMEATEEIGEIPYGPIEVGNYRLLLANGRSMPLMDYLLSGHIRGHGEPAVPLEEVHRIFDPPAILTLHGTPRLKIRSVTATNWST